MSAKEKLLDAFEDILISQGENSATLDAVAQKAGVSKGGLLYHFPSKTALITGLTNRLEARMNEDVSLMQQAPGGVAAYYIRTSSITDDTYARTLIAATKLSGPQTARIVELQRNGQRTILELLTKQTGSVAAAQALLLIGDGLYHNSLIDGECSTARMPDLATNLSSISALLGAGDSADS